LNDFVRLEDQLLAIEARVGLLEACRPLGLAREQIRLEQLLSAGADPAQLMPRVEFPRRASLDLELVRLEQIELALSRADGKGSGLLGIFAGRAQELVLDAQLVRARGTPDMVRLARRRFLPESSEELGQAGRMAEQWLEQGIARVPSADESLVDLAAQLRQLLSISGLDIEVCEVQMVARAAVSERALLVCKGTRVTRKQAARIFSHEVFGHLLPRRAAMASGPPFRIGPRGADADEEGRALHLEMTLGHMDPERRLELAVRHVLAAEVLDGGHIGEALARLGARGVPAALLATSAPRVARAGGLCREIIYLPGLLRVGPSLADPEVERVFRSGRATLAEVPELRRLLAMSQAGQSKSATTGV
jgi:hypothetical protein